VRQIKRQPAACRPCRRLAAFAPAVVAALGDAWEYDGDPAEGVHAAIHADGRRRLSFNTPHNSASHPDIVYVWQGSSGEFGLRPDGDALHLPMGIDALAAATAILHMPLGREPEPAAPAPGAQPSPGPSTAIRAMVGRLRLRFDSVGALLDETVRVEGETPVIDAHGPFGDATAAIDPDGKVRLALHSLDIDIAAAVIGALAAANTAAAETPITR
jgi:hypothetical protein